MIWRDFANHAAWLRLHLTDEDLSPNELGPNSPLRSRFDQCHDKWTTLVSVYSGRDLSYQEDKLPALSAIAALFQKQTQDEYICGLWRKSILYDMTWAPAKHWIDRRSKPQSYVGPSWSWISHPDLVQYVDRWNDKEEAAKLISVAVTPRYSFAPLGQVSQAAVVLEGPFFTLQLKKGPSSDWLLHAISTELGDCTISATFLPDYSGETPLPVAAELDCLVLHGAEPTGEQHLVHASGLVLAKANGNAFVRAGLFEAYAHAWRNEEMLQHDGCACRERGYEARRRRDREITQVLLRKSRRTVTIE